MKLKIRILSFLSFLFLALGCTTAFAALCAPPAPTARASVSAYADTHPTLRQLNSIGYRIDSGYQVNSNGDSTIFFNGSPRTFFNGSTSINVLRQSAYTCMFLTVNDAAPVPAYISPSVSNNPYYDRTNIGSMWNTSNLTLATPQSINDLYIDARGRIYFPYSDHKGRFVNYYLGTSGFTDSPAGGSTATRYAIKPAARNLVYNGSLQYGVSAGSGYTLTGTSAAAAAGNYTAYASLQSGYQWSDGTTGMVTLRWSISPAALSGAAVVIPSQTYTGSPLTPVPTLVSVGGRALQYGTDYTCVWSSNTDAGTGTARITGKGNYAGYLDKTFAIAPADIGTAEVTLAQTGFIYSGNACQPAVDSVVFRGKTLSAGTDYTVSYKSNVNAGTGYAVVTGKGDFAGYVKEVPFTVAPLSVSGAVFSQIGEQVYTGGAIEPKPSVTLGGKVLTEGTDFAYSYTDNLHRGTATVTATGKPGSNYTGTASATFEIGAKDLSSGIVAADIFAVVYTGGAHTPKPVLRYNGKTLEEGRDYALVYSDNRNAGTATIAVTGRGNYSGTLPLTFTIEKAEQTFLPPGTITLEALTGTEQIVLSGTVSTGTTQWKLTASSDARVVSVEKNGKLTAGNKVGTATIDVYNPGDANYMPRTRSVAVRTTLTDGFFIGNLTGENTVYPTLQAAFDAAADGGRVYAAGSPALSATANVAGKTLTLAGYGAGASLSRNGYNGCMLAVARGGELTIENVTLDGGNVAGDSLVVSSGGLTLGSGASFVNGRAEHGGAVKAGGGSLRVRPGASFVGNTATGNGGAIYIANGVEAFVLGGEMRNNAATVGNAVYLENGILNFNGGMDTEGITDSIGIGGYGKILPTGGLTHKIAVEFADPAAQMTEQEPYRSYVESADGALSGAEMKEYFRVVNPGYTFNGEAAVNALVLQTSKTEAARFTDAQGIAHSFFDLQAAIDGAARLGGAITIELVQYQNDFDSALNSNTIELASTLVIPDGAKITFSSVVKHTDGTGADYTYEAAASATIVKRADNLTGEMIRVEAGGALTLGNVTLDGGAVWRGGVPVVTDDGKGGAGTAVTSNAGVTAHAPVLVNRGELTMNAGAEVRNNDNNYARPGEGFGSQNYGGGVRNEGAGRFVMTGGAIENCYSREGGAVMNVNKPGTPGYVENGNAAVIVSGGTIAGNISQMKGAAVQTIYGGANTVIAGNVEIRENTSLHDLGTLAVEEGGMLTVSGGTVAAGGENGNAVYVYNKYGAENYDKNSASKPFIEGKSPAKFILSGSPGLGGADGSGGEIFLGNPCFVVDPATGAPSETRYHPVVELRDYTGGRVNVCLDKNRAYGDTVVSDSGGLASKATIAAPAHTSGYAHSDRFFYEAEENGTYRLKYSGYDLEIGQSRPGALTVRGVCDETIGRIAATMGKEEYAWTATEGVIEGEIDLSGKEGVSFAAAIKACDGSGRALSEDLTVGCKVIKFDPTTAGITAPEGTKYIAGDGSEKEVINGTLPNDVALDADGRAKFVLDGTWREIYLGLRADEIPPQELPETAGGLHDLTDTAVTLDGKADYEYNLVDESGHFVGDWKKAENAGADGTGTVVFEGLSPGASYAAAVRRPAVLSGAAVEKIPGKYVATGRTATALTQAEAAAKRAFEEAYEKIKDRLLPGEGGGAAEPSASSDEIETATRLYDKIAETAQASKLPGIREKIAHLRESYDHALANEWKKTHENILGKQNAGIENKNEADAALDGYEALTGGAKTLSAREYAQLVQTKKAIAKLEIDAEAEEWTTQPNQGGAEEIRKIADGYLSKIGKLDENTADVRDATDLLTAQALAALEVRGRYDALLAENSELTERGKETLAKLLQDELAGVETTAAGSVEAAAHAANAEILLRWQKETAKYEYETAFSAITGGAPPPSETEAAFAAVESAGDPAAINAVLSERVKELLGGLVFEKDSTETKRIIESAKNAVDTAIEDANGKIADVGSAVGKIRAEVEKGRRAEKADAQRALDAAAQGSVGHLSAASRAEAEKLIEEAKQGIDEGFFADYPLLAEKALAKLEVLRRCDEILTAADEKGYVGREDVAAAKNEALGRIDGAENSARTQEEKKSGILVLDKEEGVLFLKNYLNESDSREVSGLVTGSGGAESRIDGAADKAEAERIVEETVNAIDAGRFRDRNNLRKPFAKISRADWEPLQEAQREYGALADAVKAVLDGEARGAGYVDCGKWLDDCLGKARFEAEKSAVLDAAAALVRAHDGERVREILGEELGNIQTIGYQPHPDDASRDAYAQEMAGKLDAAFAAARVEIEHAQKQQRTENQLIRDFEQKLASGRYNDAQKQTLQALLFAAKETIGETSSRDGAALDRILEETIAALNEVPVSSVSTDGLRPDGTGECGDGVCGETAGIVSNDASMPGGVKLVIEKTEKDGGKAVLAAIKNGRLTAAEGNALNAAQLLALVEGKEIKAALDIYLLKNNGKITEFQGKYVVKILMTPELRSMVGLQVVSADDDGTVRVYDTTIEEGKYLVFATTRISGFCILGEKEIDLLWLIVLLSVLLAIEAIVIFLLAKRKKEDEEENADSPADHKPVRLRSFAPAVLAAVITPHGAVAACIALGGLVTLGGGVIAALVIKGPFLTAKTRGNAKTERAAEEGDGAEIAAAACADASPVVLPVPGCQPGEPAVLPVSASALRAEERRGGTAGAGRRVVVIQYRKSFTARLIQAEDTVKDTYSELKNEIMSYGVKCRASWRGETFRKGKKLVRIQFKGQTLALSLALRPGEYAGTKYKVEDMSGAATGKDLPCVYRIRNARRAGYAADLIADVMAAADLAKQERKNVDYKAKFPYEDTGALIEKGLIRVLTAGGDEAALEKGTVRASVTVREAATLLRDEAAEARVKEDGRLADKTRAGVVNIDTLSRVFGDGERVTLAEMKRRIPALNKKTTYVKVLARGQLNKALIVEADDFSLDAAKMILLTGGQAIRSRRL